MVLKSRDNPRVRRWRELARDAALRRSEGSAILEGAHLVDAFLRSGGKPRALLVDEAAQSESEVARLVAAAGIAPIVVSKSVLKAIADAETPPALVAEVPIREAKLDPARWRRCVLLDAIQDAGNVGAILRSAAAFGLEDVVLGAGCADAWSPKVLRAAQGGHFALRIARSNDLAQALAGFSGAVLGTVPRGGRLLAECDLAGRIAWLFGSEGQGLAPRLLEHVTARVRIPMAEGAESLNVAAAAAVCFYEGARGRSK